MAENLFYSLLEIWGISGMPFRWGMTIALAMVVGFFLYRSRGNWKWIASWVAFALLHSWVMLAACTELFTSCRPIASLIIISIASFTIGTMSGMILASRSEKRQECNREAARSVIQDIRVNNGFTKN